MKHAAIVHFNTPELTSALVRSIRKWSPGLAVSIFDNSDRRPFPQTEGVTVFDNTRGQIIDFDKLLAQYPDKRDTLYYHASAKHIASVDWMFDQFPDGFLLLDSDVLLKREIESLADTAFAWCGMIERPYERYKTIRLLPYLLWIGVPICREHGIRFWHEGKVYKLSHHGSPYHDTGGSFFEDCDEAGLPCREIDIYDYIIHFGSASYSRTQGDALRWLDENKYYYG